MKNWEKSWETESDEDEWMWRKSSKAMWMRSEHEMWCDEMRFEVVKCVTSSSYFHSIFFLLLFSKVLFGINIVLVVPSDFLLLLFSSLVKRFQWLHQTLFFYPGEWTFVHCVALFFIVERWYSLWRRRMKTLSIVLLLCFDAETNFYSNPFRGGCQVKVKPFNASYLFA